MYPSLCRFLEGMLGRDREAQDIAQESFLRLCQANFGEISVVEVRYWLFKVARNLALNEINKNKTRLKFWERLAEIFQRNEADPADGLVKDENRKIVTELVQRLPEHQRLALLLREREEMNYREIALALNASESKIKVDIFRARQSLRKLWQEREENRSGEL